MAHSGYRYECRGPANTVDVLGNFVGERIMIAVARRGPQQLPDRLHAFEIAFDGGDHLIHRQLLVLEDKLLDRRKRIHDGAESDALKVTQVDAVRDLRRMQIEAVLHAQIVQRRTHRLSEMTRPQFTDDVLLGKRGLAEQKLLRDVGVPQLLPTAEPPRVVGSAPSRSAYFSMRPSNKAISRAAAKLM
jgi:hypothetical protein